MIDAFVDALDLAELGFDGVEPVPELARRNAAELAKKMAEVGKVKKLTRRMPSEAEISKWIAQAKTLPRALEY